MAKDRHFEARARALVGTRFRPQGRAGEGVDCLGLIILVFDIPDTSVRRDYRLRGDHEAEVKEGIRRFFRRAREARPGDLMLLRVAPDQLHFAVRTHAGFVHADAGLRRVVETPGLPPWPPVGIFRRKKSGS